MGWGRTDIHCLTRQIHKSVAGERCEFCSPHHKFDHLIYHFYLLPPSLPHILPSPLSQGVLCRDLKGHAHWVNTMALSTDYSLRTAAFDPGDPTLQHTGVQAMECEYILLWTLERNPAQSKAPNTSCVH